MMSQSAMLAISLLLLASGVSVYGRDVRVKRLISGMESDLSESPYMVSLQGEFVTSSFFGIPVGYSSAYCGGTIISDRWVLTAAHCFSQSADPADWHARIASKNIERSGYEEFLHILGKLTDRVEWQQMEYHPQQIIIHPQYASGVSYDDDIALVKLRETIPFSETDRVGKIDLASSSDSLIAQNCTAYGWGCSSYGDSVTESIQKVTLPMLSDSECATYWSLSHRTQICAGGREGNMQSACHGDSGGPLVCQTTEGTTKQVGIMSFISSEDPIFYPVVMTKISAYTSWINKYIN